jgi:hypothetical protein
MATMILAPNVGVLLSNYLCQTISNVDKVMELG